MTWLVPVLLESEYLPYIATFEYATLMAIAELFRRWIWALIRIENEQVSNLEQYRYILEVPELGSTEADVKTEEHYNNLVKKIVQKQKVKNQNSATNSPVLGQ